MSAGYNVLLRKAAAAKRKLQEAESKARAAKEVFSAAEAELMAAMQAEDLRTLNGAGVQAAITRRDTPTIEDPEALYKYIKRTGALDLLQRRLNAAAWRARIEDGKRPPGITVISKLGLRFKFD